MPRGVASVSTLEQQIINLIVRENATEICNRMYPAIEQQIVEKFGIIPKILEIHGPAGSVKQVKGVFHEKFKSVLDIVSMNIPVYLTGKAGTGKNVICKQIAEALGLDFYFTNAVTQEYKLTGFIDANGKYHETQFFKAFTNGGLFFLDEMDASIPEVLVILNAAIANGYFDFPTGKFEAHPNFRVIAAGNTIGTGADNNYTGRFQLDRASLDRFAMINIGYSPTIEISMAGGDKSIVNFAHWFREATEKRGIECLFSYRTISRMAKLIPIMPLEDVIECSLLKGLDREDIKYICTEMDSAQLAGKYKRDDTMKFYQAMNYLCARS